MAGEYSLALHGSLPSPTWLTPAAGISTITAQQQIGTLPIRHKHTHVSPVAACNASQQHSSKQAPCNSGKDPIYTISSTRHTTTALVVVVDVVVIAVTVAVTAVAAIAVVAAIAKVSSLLLTPSALYVLISPLSALSSLPPTPPIPPSLCPLLPSLSSFLHPPPHISPLACLGGEDSLAPHGSLSCPTEARNTTQQQTGCQSGTAQIYQLQHGMHHSSTREKRHLAK